MHLLINVKQNNMIINNKTLILCYRGILFEGNSIVRSRPHQRARSGIAYVPQGREIIPYLTVEENLMLGMESLEGGLSVNQTIDRFSYRF